MTDRHPAPVCVHLAVVVAARDLGAVMTIAWPRYGPTIKGYARRAGASETEVDDIVADTFAAVVQQWANFSGEGFVAWLFTLARLAVRSALRRNHRERERSSPDDVCSLPATVADPEVLVDARRSVLVVRRLVANFEPVDQYIFVARVEGWSDSTTMAALQADLDLVLSANHLAVKRKRMRDRIEKALTTRGLR